ncbi:hypothetical protein DPMN_033593 [Dreissena polymorpha]|uniref:Uncharacterized protein n=1 Tax=Dreissena polymorpha TaxID=45954 RepID=A0A9D4RL45_DREPO|nr:hypothetical protein DPMN_033593 [Dreissena polymorpha]
MVRTSSEFPHSGHFFLWEGEEMEKLSTVLERLAASSRSCGSLCTRSKNTCTQN